MSVGAASSEVVTFKDVSEEELRTLTSIGVEAVLGLRAIDEVLQTSEKPQPVISIGTHYVGQNLPHIWMGIGMTEPGKGLQYIRDQNADIRRELPIHGLAIPVDPASVSSVKFYPHPMPQHEDQTSEGWWEHWQRYRFTQHLDGSVNVHDYERAVGFPPFAAWFDRDTDAITEWGFSEGVQQTDPVIIEDAVEAASITLEPHNAPLRHKAAIFVGKGAVETMLLDSTRLGIPANVASRPYRTMIETVARELGLA